MSDAEAVLLELNPNELQRFWSKVEKRGADECWPWTRALTWGYGSWRVRKILYRANRVALILSSQKLLGELDACHTCDFHACCNPAHLFPGTRKENMQDSVQKGRTKGIRVGSKNGFAKLDEEKVRAIKTMLHDKVKQKVIAELMNVKQCTISLINTGFIWGHVDSPTNKNGGPEGPPSWSSTDGKSPSL